MKLSLLVLPPHRADAHGSLINQQTGEKFLLTATIIISDVDLEPDLNYSFLQSMEAVVHLCSCEMIKMLHGTLGLHSKT